MPRGSKSKQTSKERPLTPEEEEAAMKLEKRVKRYLPVELDVDTSRARKITPNETNSQKSDI